MNIKLISTSGEEINPKLTRDYKNIPASIAIRDHMGRSERLYDELIEEGVAEEYARMVLPLGWKKNNLGELPSEGSQGGHY